MATIDNINIDLFDICTDSLIKIIESSIISQREKKYRKKILINTYNKMINYNYIDNKYYSLAHEIKSLELLMTLPNTKLVNDHNSTPGCDFRINDYYNIECVACTSGDEQKNGYNEFYGTGVFDYNKKENIILTRILQALNEKKEFYYKHLNGSINLDEPYIVFLSLGNLSYGSFFGKYGFSLNKILFGVHHQGYIYDNVKQKFTGTTYQYRDEILNHNDSPISCRFYNEDNSFISAIIFTTATLDEQYSLENTYIFINPFAKNKVIINKLPKLVYWKENKNGEYIPRYNGKNMNNKLKSNIF